MSVTYVSDGDLATPANLNSWLNEAGGEIFNVKTYGALGDGATDDSAAIQAALDAAKAAISGREGSKVIIPRSSTFYALESSIEIPIGVRLVGAGFRASRLKWTGASAPASAVITSNLSGEYSDGITHGSAIEDIRVDCNGEAVGIAVAGWNEFCYMRSVEVVDFTTTGYYISAVTPPTTSQSGNAVFEMLRAVSATTGSSHGFRIRSTSLCTFNQLTADVPDGSSDGCDVGVQIEERSNNNVFISINAEECDIAIDLGVTSECEGNTFIGPNWSNDNLTPADQTIGSITSESIGILIRSGVDAYHIIGARDGGGSNRDHGIYDEGRDRSWSGNTRYPLIIAGNSGRFIDEDFHIGSQVNISADTDNLNVGAASSIQVSTSGGNVTIGGLTGGVADQRLTIFKATSANSLIIEHNEGLGDQNIITNDASDITLASFGGVNLICNGTNWFVVSE